MMRGGAAEQSRASSREDAHVVLPVSRFDRNARVECLDAVVQEVRIEAVVDGKPAFATTCSPWDIEELVIGRLFFEGIVDDASILASVRLCGGGVCVEVRLDRRAEPAHDACTIIPFDRLPRFSVSARTLGDSVAMLERQSFLFRKTGGVHSAALVDGNGAVRVWREDIGRHSAIDKVAGWCVLHDVDPSNLMVLFSGRIPQEIVAKVVALGCPIIASPGAPTNLSIETAERAGVTLVGFAKEGRFNVYAHPERIVEHRA